MLIYYVLENASALNMCTCVSGDFNVLKEREPVLQVHHLALQLFGHHVHQRQLTRNSLNIYDINFFIDIKNVEKNMHNFKADC